MASAFLAVQSGNYSIVAQQNIPINTNIDPIYLIKIIVVLLAGIFVVGIFRDEDPTVIMPFETCIRTEKCSGKAISDLLIANLVRISRIQGAKYEEMTIKRNAEIVYKIGKENLTSLSLSTKNNTGTFDQGFVVLGPTSFSLGQLLRILKQICHGNDPGMVITGSLQKYRYVISLVAIMEQKGTKAWEVRRSIKANNDIEYEDISSMISELAYKIFFDQSEKDISAKSWSGLKYFTQALDSYQQYKLTGDIKILEKAHNECIEAVNVNPGYEKPITLLHNIAIAYWKKNKNYEAEKLFRQIVILEPDNIDTWEWWGIALRFFHLDEAAIKCYQKVLDKNPEPAMKAEIYCMKAISYRNLKKFNKSISCIKKSLLLNNKYGLAYQYLGQAYIMEGKIDEAIKAFENCEKYDINLTLIHPSLARLYEKKGNYKKSSKHCEKAKNSLEGRTEYNRACYEAICGTKEAAIDLLKIVFIKKQVVKKWIQKDPDMEKIRDDPVFKNLLDKYDDTKEDDPSILLSQVAIYRKLDLDLENKDEMFKNIRSLLKDEKREYDCARYYAICTDNREKAVELLREAIIKKQKSPEIALYDPDFEFICDDPRFQMLLEEFIEGQEIHSNI